MNLINRLGISHSNTLGSSQVKEKIRQYMHSFYLNIIINIKKKYRKFKCFAFI